jgi:DNA modification methylase
LADDKTSTQNGQLFGNAAPSGEQDEVGSSIQSRPEKRANDLDGSEWTRNSISVWADIRKSKQEEQLRHPAMFPEALASRLIKSFTKNTETRILDPFMGSGATLSAAHKLGRQGIGVEVYPAHIEKARFRFQQDAFVLDPEKTTYEPKIISGDARHLATLVDSPVDMCITSPPYWDILEQKRTADQKQIRNYGESEDDLGKIQDYEKFLDQLDRVWGGVHSLLKPGGYFCVIVMDLRKANKFYPFHMNLWEHITKIGVPAFELDDIIIWNRQAEYNNLRCLGFPYTFRVNKVHEFILIFQKPKT